MEAVTKVALWNGVAEATRILRGPRIPANEIQLIGSIQQRVYRSAQQRVSSMPCRIVPPLGPPLASESQVEAKIATLDNVNRSVDRARTVHVKFKLERACKFGQQFLLAGEDPIFGFWDPSKAVPLQWTDGHIWTASMDLPVGKMFQFKFILRGYSGDVKWQPGPDRILQTWDTSRTIVVSGDWDAAAGLNITEEEDSLTILKEQMASMENDSAIAGGPMIMTEEALMAMGEEGFEIPSNKQYIVPGMPPLANPSVEELFSREVVSEQLSSV